MLTQKNVFLLNFSPNLLLFAFVQLLSTKMLKIYNNLSCTLLFISYYLLCVNCFVFPFYQNSGNVHIKLSEIFEQIPKESSGKSPVDPDNLTTLVGFI